jgi:hypothetical protein
MCPRYWGQLPKSRKSASGQKRKQGRVDQALNCMGLGLLPVTFPRACQAIAGAC